MKRKKSFIHIDWKIGLIFLVFSVCCRTVYAQTVSVELKKATVAEAFKGGETMRVKVRSV